MNIIESVNKKLRSLREFRLKSTPIKYNDVKVTQTIKDGQTIYKLKGPARNVVLTLLQMKYEDRVDNAEINLNIIRKSPAFTKNKTITFYFAEK